MLHPASDALYLQVIQKGFGKVLRLPYGAGAKAEMLPLPAGQQVAKTATDQSVPGAVLDLTSWTDPGDYYRYDEKKKTTTTMLLQPPNKIDPVNLTSEEVQVKAQDGTMVPLSIIYKKELVRDGSAPAALIGYGAYGDAFTPGFSRRYMGWLERGGVLGAGAPGVFSLAAQSLKGPISLPRR